MRFTLFLVVLVILSLALIYVVGDRRQPTLRVIEQDVPLEIGQ